MFEIHKLKKWVNFEPRINAKPALRNWRKRLFSLVKIEVFLFLCYFQTTGSTTKIAFIMMRLSKEFLNSSRVPSGARMTKSVELCDCPREFTGDSCQQCAEGYTRLVPNSGPYRTCVPCSCNGNSDRCDSNTGVCLDCKYNTTG